MADRGQDVGLLDGRLKPLSLIDLEVTHDHQRCISLSGAAKKSGAIRFTPNETTDCMDLVLQALGTAPFFHGPYGSAFGRDFHALPWTCFSRPSQ